MVFIIRDAQIPLFRPSTSVSGNIQGTFANRVVISVLYSGNINSIVTRAHTAFMKQAFKRLCLLPPCDPESV